MKAATREIADQDAVPFDGKVKAVPFRIVGGAQYSFIDRES